MPRDITVVVAITAVPDLTAARLNSIKENQRPDGPRFVLDDNPPAFALPKLVGDNARDDVRRRARAASEDDADHVGRVGLRGGRSNSLPVASSRDCESGKMSKLHFTLLGSTELQLMSRRGASRSCYCATT